MHSPASPIPPCVNATTIGCTLVQVAARALSGQDCRDLPIATVVGAAGRTRSVGNQPLGEWSPRAGGVTADRIMDIDPDEVAEWFVGRYTGTDQYPGVMFGSPHGAATNLAAATGMPWLPAGFRVEVSWSRDAHDDLELVMARGCEVQRRLAGRFDGVTVTQVHDPVRLGRLAGRRTTHYVRWRALPPAYARFLDDRVEAAAPIVALNDARRWYGHGGATRLQIGSPVAGLTPAEYLAWLPALSPAVASATRADARPGTDAPAERSIDPDLVNALVGRAAETGRSMHAITYSAPPALSAVVADTYRTWLRAAGKTGNRLAISCGRLIDAFQVVQRGLVPYWCERATLAEVDAMELWLAGSEPFSSIDILPDTMNEEWPGVAGIERWSQIGAFATRRGSIDRRLRRAVDLTDAPAVAGAVLSGHPYDPPAPGRMTIDDVLAAIDGPAYGGHDVYRSPA